MAVLRLLNIFFFSASSHHISSLLISAYQNKLVILIGHNMFPISLLCNYEIAVLILILNPIVYAIQASLSKDY